MSNQINLPRILQIGAKASQEVGNILRGLNLSGFAQGLIQVSNVTGEGMVNLEGALSRILNLGEEVED